MNPIDIINEFYRPDSKACKILINHGKQVARKALEVAERISHLNPDKKFIDEASMLHDIGIFMTDVPEIGCFGEHPYVVHGLLGRVILDHKELPKHALVCERHVGAGITAEDIKTQRLLLPIRDMIPVTIEEKIICFADKFYSKDPENSSGEKSVDEIMDGLGRYGQQHVEKFKSWAQMFKEI